MEADSLIRKYSGNTTLQAKYGYAQVKHIVTQMSMVKEVNPTPPPTEEVIPKFKRAKPKVVKKGDVFLGTSSNGKCRPIVVAKVVRDVAYCINLTTTNDEYALLPHNSRFMDAGYYTNYFIKVKLSFIRSMFIGVMDDNRGLNKAIKEIVNSIKQDFK